MDFTDSIPYDRTESHFVKGEMTYSVTNKVQGYYKSKVSTGVQRMKPHGWLDPTPYKVRLFTRDPIKGERIERGDLRDPSDLYVISGAGWESITPSLAVPPRDYSLKQRAEVQCLLKLKDQKVNLVTALATAGQTADMVAKSANDIAKLVKTLRDSRKWDFRTVKKGLFKGMRGLPNSFLEHKFGWAPTMQDVAGSIEQLQDEARTTVVTVKATVKNSFKGEQLLYPDSSLQAREEYQGSAGCYVRLDFMPRNTYLSTLSQVGVTNPATTLWELVPYSFIVDWFLPIGDWLETLDATLGFDFLGGSYTFREEGNYTYTPEQPNDPWVVSVDGKGRSHALYLERGVYQIPPFPDLPSFKSPLSLTHVAEALSLLATRFSR